METITYDKKFNELKESILEKLNNDYKKELTSEDDYTNIDPYIAYIENQIILLTHEEEIHYNKFPEADLVNFFIANYYYLPKTENVIRNIITSVP